MSSPRRSNAWLLPGLALGGAALAAVWLSDPARLLRVEFARQRLIAGAKVRRLSLADGQIVYLEAGRGPPLLHIHGFTGMKENFLPLIGPLGKGWRHLAPDLPGWGESERIEGADYGYAEQARRLAEFIDAIGAGPVDVVGHSMGGGIAAVLAARYPERVRRLVLMDASGVRFSDNAFGLAVLEGENPFGVSDEASLRNYLGLVFDKVPWMPRSVARLMVRQRIAQAGFEQGILDSIGRSEDAFLPEQEAAAIRAPTLLLWCRGDRVIDASAAAIYAAKIPDNRIVLMDGASHMPMFECKAATVAALREFLQ
ncbi:MAG: alpha/beta hydrolase [Gammaproteobacteria bacterium]|nr:alpha/beta hydrolase [Gammaproteobacteria bacterium]